LNEDREADRGRSTQERDDSDMIDQKPVAARRLSAVALDESHLRQHAIGVGLRKIFDEVVQEDVPESFLEILRRADASGPER
jgi:hypothetical protein